MTKARNKKDIKLEDFKGHSLYNIKCIEKVYIYYGDELELKISFTNHPGDSVTFTLNINKGPGTMNLYKDVLTAIQRAKEAEDEFLVIYGTNANLLSEINII